ncbi:uncharacterized protein LOC144150276 [Haemaphysalis longicornis]
MALVYSTVLCLGLLSAVLPFTTGSCNLPSDASVEAEIKKLLDAMPKERENPFMSGNVFPGFSVEGMKVVGFDNLQRYGPIQTFCKNTVSESGNTISHSIAQMDFITVGGFGVSVPWKTCADSNGIINVQAGLTRFTLQFRLEPARPDRRDALKLTPVGGMRPVAVEDVDLIILGAGHAVRDVGFVVGKLFNSQLRELLLEVMDWQMPLVFEQEDRAIATNEVEY